MARRPLAVVQFGQYPDGPLAEVINDSQGWGTTNPVPMHHLDGVWPAFSTLGGTWLRGRGRVSAGRLTPPPTEGVTGQVDATELMVDLAAPAAGRWECQLAAGSELNDAALSQMNAGTGFLLHAGIGLTTLDGLHGIALIRSSSLSQVLVYTWDASSGPVIADVQVPSESDDFSTTLDAGGLSLAINWATGGPYVCTANGTPVGAPRALPVPATELRPILIAGRYRSFPDQFGISWAALTEEAPLPAVPVRADPPRRPGFTLHAADWWGRERAEIIPDSWTWKWGLDSSTVEWAHAHGGPKITPYATHALVCHARRRYLAGPVTTQARSHNPENGLERSWSAIDRRGQIEDTRVIYPTHRRTFDQVPLRDVIESLLGDTQHLPGGDMGVRIDPDMPAGPTITLPVNVRDSVGAAITQAVELAGGEWTIDRHDLLRWYPEARGGRRDWIARVATADEQSDGTGFATALWVTGEDEAAAVFRQAPDIATRAEGRIDRVVADPDQRHPAGLAARADRLITDATNPRPAYTVELAPGTWTPALAAPGDTCRLIDPPLGTDEWVRIFEISMTKTADGAETVHVTYGAPPPSIWRDLDRQRRSIDRLNRR